MCLEHVIDLNLCLKKIPSVLKKDGYLIIRVPYKENLQEYLKNSYPYNYSHLRNFDEESLLILMEKVFNLQFLELKRYVIFWIIIKLFFL